MSEKLSGDRLRGLHFALSEHLNEIAGLFKNDIDVKLTLVIRTPELGDGGVLISNDEYDAAIAEINRLRVKEPVQP